MEVKRKIGNVVVVVVVVAHTKSSGSKSAAECTHVTELETILSYYTVYTACNKCVLLLNKRCRLWIILVRRLRAVTISEIFSLKDHMISLVESEVA